jgi:hypothetical protein
MGADLYQLSEETRYSEPALARASVYARFLHLALTDRQLDESAANELVRDAARMGYARHTELTDAVHAMVKRVIAREIAHTAYRP